MEATSLRVTTICQGALPAIHNYRSGGPVAIQGGAMSEWKLFWGVGGGVKNAIVNQEESPPSEEG